MNKEKFLRFLHQYKVNRDFGLPFWWSVKSAWYFRNGPNQKLKDAYKRYKEGLDYEREFVKLNTSGKEVSKD